MKKLMYFASIAAIILFAMSAEAETTMRAKVTKVVPVKETSEYVETVETCRQVQVPVTETVPVYQEQLSTTAPLYGAITGAAIGYGVARRGSHQKEAAVVGALLGAYSQRNRTRQVQVGEQTRIVYQMQNQCHTQTVPRTETIVTGYETTYKLNGESHVAVLPEHPGEYVNVVTHVTVY